MDAAPAPLSSSFGAFSIRRARAFVLVSYSLNAGRCHIGRRLDAAPRGGLVCVEALASCCTKRTGRVIRPTKGRTLHTGQKNSAGRPPLLHTSGRLSTLSILSIFGACLVTSSMCGGCPCCLYLSISGAVQFISRGRGRVEALASCCTKRQTRQKNSAARPPFSPRRGGCPRCLYRAAVCSSSVEAVCSSSVCPSCRYACIASTRRAFVHIVHVVHIRAGNLHPLGGAFLFAAL